jgi:hypothetical protein
MSKCPMRGHFRHLRFKTFPMRLLTPQCEVFFPLLSSSEHSGVPTDSKSPTFPSVGLHPHTWPKWGCDTQRDLGARVNQQPPMHQLVVLSIGWVAFFHSAPNGVHHNPFFLLLTTIPFSFFWFLVVFPLDLTSYIVTLFIFLPSHILHQPWYLIYDTTDNYLNN